ncbi:uncharacterized protein C8R40DRAFT_609193 [Lentinula edodes]|uniref:uncharacterized protein n=1 Tax=Lentinula edodes TaxID=5353 RepID=UPI001E8E4A7C|nr:uncharacterized protein C8R40DRAFT_609193 [Lentinula edodes]KAH7871039.1 hypothetical protein C8R40DRAFT_609193 [Lentinula edodes]
MGFPCFSNLLARFWLYLAISFRFFPRSFENILIMNVLNSHSFSYSVDAGTSSYTYLKNGPPTSCDTTNSKTTSSSMDHCTIVEQQSYTEFCLKLGSTMPKQEDARGNTLESPRRRRSYVCNWRQNITPLKIGPPPSPLGISDFPTSPVAIVSAEQLRVTSLPPYDPRTASALAGSSTSELSEQSIVDEPTNFHDLYDAELEQIIDGIETSSASSSSLSATVYIPPAN